MRNNSHVYPMCDSNCTSSLSSPFLSPLPPPSSSLPKGSAGTFQLLQEQVFAHLQTSPTPDLSAESTTALVQIMLAQAQESFCIKAARGKSLLTAAMGEPLLISTTATRGESLLISTTVARVSPCYLVPLLQG